MYKIKTSLLFFVIATISICFFSMCSNVNVSPDYNDYPADIGKIMVTKCAVSGCHNDASKDAAGGLSLTTWNKLFEGGTGSACVIPYRHEFSTACYYINTYTDLGVTLTPTMPYNKTHLTHDDVKLIENWVDAGAPNENGFVKFSDNPHRKKFYVANQGCDVVTVFDEATLLPMRYIDIGNSGAVEAPHEIVVSPDGNYWYVVFFTGNCIQKYRTADDGFVGQAILNLSQPIIINGQWSTFAITPDGSKAYVIDWSTSINCDIAEVDLNNLTVTHHVGFNGPHGSCISPDGQYLYASQQNSSNQLYKILLSDFDNNIGQVNLYSGGAPSAYLNSHQITFAPSPNDSTYYVTCQGSSEVRVMKCNPTGSDTFITAIAVGENPSEMDVSSTKNLLFVTCETDNTSFPGKTGSVAVIDMTTNTLVTTIYTGHQPHGIAVDDTKNIVYVANRNRTTGGPPPHHSSVCGGRNGYLTFIDMNTLSLVKTKTGADKKVEVAVDPYEIAIRH